MNATEALNAQEKPIQAAGELCEMLGFSIGGVIINKGDAVEVIIDFWNSGIADWLRTGIRDTDIPNGALIVPDTQWYGNDVTKSALEALKQIFFYYRMDYSFSITQRGLYLVNALDRTFPNKNAEGNTIDKEERKTQKMVLQSSFEALTDESIDPSLSIAKIAIITAHWAANRGNLAYAAYALRMIPSATIDDTDTFITVVTQLASKYGLHIDNLLLAQRQITSLTETDEGFRESLTLSSEARLELANIVNALTMDDTLQRISQYSGVVDSPNLEAPNTYKMIEVCSLLGIQETYEGEYITDLLSTGKSHTPYSLSRSRSNRSTNFSTPMTIANAIRIRHISKTEPLSPFERTPLLLLSLKSTFPQFEKYNVSDEQLLGMLVRSLRHLNRQPDRQDCFVDFTKIAFTVAYWAIQNDPKYAAATIRELNRHLQQNGIFHLQSFLCESNFSFDVSHLKSEIAISKTGAFTPEAAQELMCVLYVMMNRPDDYPYTGLSIN